MPDSAPAPTVFPPLPDAPIQALRWDAIERSPLNPRKRFDEAEIAALADAIAADGLLQNLVVRPHPAAKGKFELLAGERRHRAIAKLIETGRADPARLWPARVTPCEDREAMMLALAENVARKDLTPLEEAEAFRRMLGLKLSKEEIARAAGCTPRQVELRVKLLTALTPKALAALKEGRISLEHARELTKAPPKRQDSILDRIVPPGRKVDDPEEAFTYDEIVTAEQLRAELRRDSVPASEAVFDPALYKGARFVDPDDGAAFFEDPDEFEKLQKAAIEAKGKALAARNAGGVEFVGDAWRAEALKKGNLPYGWAKAPKDVAAAGKASALFGILGGKFVVVEGLAKTRERSGSGDSETETLANVPGAKKQPGAPAPAKPEDIPVGAARQALTVRTHAIQTAIAADVTHAKRAVVFALLGDRDIVRIQDGLASDGKGTIAPAVAAILDRFAKRGFKRNEWAAGERQGRRWATIAALTPADLDALFAALVAQATSVESGYARDCWPEADELVIAATVKADPAATFALDADFLAKLKKGQLLRIVADLKLEADPRFAKGSDDLTATVIRKIILDAGAKLKGYVPVWCRFEAEAAMKAQLKATPKIGGKAAQASVAKIAAEKPAAKPAAKKPAPAKKAK